ncbi:MAG: asparagine synthase (glutamine-hydrolyzing) [Deltaproteobacteria bacterium]|nr:asparagine synthase (glutamine-hydrolyzing) [Deltaproteobacteria bacterium]
MCGIHGIISRSFSGDEILRRLEKMGDLQRHRGPDNIREKVFDTGNSLVGFGFVRLSILDLETGMQPVVCPLDSSAIICNGQIYNYVELKPQVKDEHFVTKGDMEVALHLYRKKGTAFLQDLNGMYAGAICDVVNRKLLLFRDRFGIKPLYYAEFNGNFFFSSEIKPLLIGGIPSSLNKSRLPTYFTYRYTPGTETIFKGIKRLPPGSFLEYDLDSSAFIVKRYWEYRLGPEDHNLTINEAEEQFYNLFEDAVRIRLRSDVEVGSLLSAGIDSSAVASMAAKSRPDIRLFTISFMEDRYNELPQVKQFIDINKKRLGLTRHHTMLCGSQTLDQLPGIIKSLEEPISLGTILPTDQVCEMAGSHLKVVLTGEGADEIFAGYRKFLIEAAAHEYDGFSLSRQKHLDEIYPELSDYMRIRASNPTHRYSQPELLYRPDELGTLLGLEKTDDLFPEDALPFLSGSEHPVNEAIAFECRARLPDYVILRLDKLSMRHSLEARTPFLDYRLAEFAARLPLDFKINITQGREKYICRRAYAKYSLLDLKTAYRRKQPFTIPIADWLASPSSLPDFLQEILLGDLIKKQGLLDPEMVRNSVNKITTEGIGPDTLVSEADRVFAVVVFSIWYNEFFT